MRSRREKIISGGRADEDERLNSVYGLVKHNVYFS
jgi:hypothetical protein